MRLLAADRQRCALAFLAVASLYSVLLGEKAYPFGLVLILVTIVLTAWIFAWFVSVLALGVSCLIVAYYVIPPIHSFRMEGRELVFFIGYTSAALTGSALVRLRKARAPVQVIPFRSAALTSAESAKSFALTCDENGALLKVSQDFLQLTGKNHRRIEGFQWLETIHGSDRAYLAKILQKGSGALRCRVRNVVGVYQWFEISIEPRFWRVPDQSSGEDRFRKTLIVTAGEDLDQS